MSRPRRFEHDAVVDAAMQAFWAGGVVATSVDDLLQASGLSRSSLYGSYGNRDGLLAAAVERYVDVQIAAIAALFARHGDADGLRRMLADAAVDNFDGRGCLLVNAINELHEGHASDAAGARVVRAAFARLAAALQRAIADAAPQRDDSAQRGAALMAAIAGL
ncbi:MAG: TetR/AcrR family transcriptional regulator, partial [Burkholderiales bacterium]|nr:TetR/AcrR family transcriptional regulator [Burkholderiales bacterium]